MVRRKNVVACAGGKADRNGNTVSVAALRAACVAGKELPLLVDFNASKRVGTARLVKVDEAGRLIVDIEASEIPAGKLYVAVGFRALKSDEHGFADIRWTACSLVERHADPEATPLWA